MSITPYGFPNPLEPWYVASLRFYVGLVRSRIPFAQANYGDGEWACILGEEGENVNREVYTNELRERLSQTLTDNNGFWCGTNPGRLHEAAEAWCKAHGVLVTWVFKETLAAANVNGELAPFFRELRSFRFRENRRTILIGPEYLNDLPRDRLIGDFEHVVVPERTAWMHEYSFHFMPGDVALFCAGIGTNIMIHQIWPAAQRIGVSLIDCGAIFDPYVGRFSRKGYRKESFQEVAMAQNLER